MGRLRSLANRLEPKLTDAQPFAEAQALFPRDIQRLGVRLVVQPPCSLATKQRPNTNARPRRAQRALLRRPASHVNIVEVPVRKPLAKIATGRDGCLGHLCRNPRV